MKMTSVSEFFKRYLPKSLPERNLTKEFTTEEIENFLKTIGINDVSSNFISYEGNQAVITFQRKDYNKWLISVKFK